MLILLPKKNTLNKKGKKMKNKTKGTSRSTDRRSFLFGSSALAAAGWVAAGTGTFVLKPEWGLAADPIKMGIATDITGAIAAGGNSCWRTAQFAVKQINDAGGILGRPIELILEDTASDPGVAVGNVRRLIQQAKVDVVFGGITSAMREAIKNPIVKAVFNSEVINEGASTRNGISAGSPVKS